MKTRKSKINALLISTVLVLTLISPIFGTESQNEKINIRNFEEAILVTDIEITRTKKAAAIEQYNLKSAEADEHTAGDSDLETKRNRGYNVKKAQKDLDYTFWLVSEKEKSVVLEGKDNYFNYLLKQDEIALQKSKIARLKKELAKIETKISLGTAVQSLKVSKELEISKEEFNLVTLEFDLESIALQLNKSLKWDLETTIDVFPTDIPTVVFDVEDLVAVVETVFENHGEVNKLNIELELAEMDLEFLEEDENNEEDDRVIIDAKADIDNLKLDIQAKKLNLEYDIRSTYNSVLNSKDQLAIKELELENLEYNLEITNKRYNVGLEVIASVEADQEAVDFGEQALKQARLDYYIQVETYKSLTTFEE
jgi:outer membrane protein TolC